MSAQDSMHTRTSDENVPPVKPVVVDVQAVVVTAGDVQTTAVEVTPASEKAMPIVSMSNPHQSGL